MIKNKSKRVRLGGFYVYAIKKTTNGGCPFEVSKTLDFWIFKFYGKKLKAFLSGKDGY